MNDHNNEDEISLRDLYLILRRGLPLIVVAALLVGGLAFVVSSRLPKVFEAQSTTLVTSPPVQLQAAQNLTFRPPNDVSFESYETLADSRPVREATLAAVPEASTVDFTGNVTLLIGPQNPGQLSPLAVTHSVRDTDPVQAAALANAWAATTLDAVRTSLLASLDPVRAATIEEIEQRQTNIDEVEARLETFGRTDDGDTLKTLLQRLTDRIADSETRRDRLARDAAAAAARVELLSQETATDGSSATPAVLAEILTLQSPTATESDPAAETANPNLTSSDAPNDDAATRDRERRSELATLLRLQPDTLTGDVVTLLNETDLRDAAVDLVGLRAEQSRIETQLASYRQQVETLLERIATLDLTRNRLTFELENARSAYQNVAALEPVITYVTTVTPSNARLLSEASVPSAPLSANRTLNTALGVVVAGLLATLFVFLREAVRPPGHREEKVTSLHNLANR